jgi:hypothetical protein
MLPAPSSLQMEAEDSSESWRRIQEDHTHFRNIVMVKQLEKEKNLLNICMCALQKVNE